MAQSDHHHTVTLYLVTEPILAHPAMTVFSADGRRKVLLILLATIAILTAGAGLCRDTAERAQYSKAGMQTSMISFNMQA